MVLASVIAQLIGLLTGLLGLWRALCEQDDFIYKKSNTNECNI